MTKPAARSSCAEAGESWRCAPGQSTSHEGNGPMPQVLTANATVLCPHGGNGTSTPSATTAPRCFVRGGQVLVENDTGVLACPNVPVPCVGYTLRSMGLNSSRIAGRRIL